MLPNRVMSDLWDAYPSDESFFIFSILAKLMGYKFAMDFAVHVLSFGEHNISTGWEDFYGSSVRLIRDLPEDPSFKYVPKKDRVTEGYRVLESFVDSFNNKAAMLELRDFIKSDLGQHYVTLCKTIKELCDNHKYYDANNLFNGLRNSIKDDKFKIVALYLILTVLGYDQLRNVLKSDSIMR